MVIHLRTAAKRSLLILLLLALAAAGIFGVRLATEHFFRSYYPLKFENEIRQYAAREEIDPNMLFALVKTESDFRPDATSRVGARGLCQIMNDTFEWIRGKLGDPACEFDEMYIPDINIRYGAYLLGTLYREFGSYEVALAAYHAGRGAVSKWLGDDRYSPDGKTLERIPIDDTGHYVDKVLKAYSRYESLYPNPDRKD